jgi:peptidoglycan-associated lipoprotein
MRLIISLLLLASVLWVAGCARGPARAPSDVVVEERGMDPAMRPSMEDEGVTAWGMDDGIPFEGDPLTDPASPLANRIVYFEFDSSEIQEDDRLIIEAHGTYLAQNPDITVTLEGHTDERGSREYNLGLGERRANAVRRLIFLMGASEDQVEVVSYGEERPAVDGHDEEAWQLNRRVELIYFGE